MNIEVILVLQNLELAHEQQNLAFRLFEDVAFLGFWWYVVVGELGCVHGYYFGAIWKRY